MVRSVVIVDQLDDHVAWVSWLNQCILAHMDPPARYDAVADFYEAGWPDSYTDATSVALLDLLGAVSHERVLDLACGHGRISRELARRGARVVGVDLSKTLLERARALEAREPLAITYVQGDAASPWLFDGEVFDAVVCSFGLTDIDDLDGASTNVARLLAPNGRFVFSLLHPCFAGGMDASGSWPTSGTYYDEGWWVADGTLSTLRCQVGANHRMLSTYVNTLRDHGLVIDRLAEPRPAEEWGERRSGAARFPVFMVARAMPLKLLPSA